MAYAQPGVADRAACTSGTVPTDILHTDVRTESGLSLSSEYLPPSLYALMCGVAAIAPWPCRQELQSCSRAELGIIRHVAGREIRAP